jgi:hypothetical protein
MTAGEARAYFTALHAQRAAIVEEFLAAFPGEGPTPRYVLRKGDSAYLASRNLTGDAAWRLTHFLAGEPSGHLEFGTLNGANHLDSLAQEIWLLRQSGYEPEGIR